MTVVTNEGDAPDWELDEAALMARIHELLRRCRSLRAAAKMLERRLESRESSTQSGQTEENASGKSRKRI
jgi:hypothetical protein